MMIKTTIFLSLACLCFAGSDDHASGSWSSSTSGSVSYTQTSDDGSSYMLSGTINAKGQVFAGGSGMVMGETSGSVAKTNSICIKGTASPSGTWKARGRYGDRSLTVSGTLAVASQMTLTSGTSGSGSFAVNPSSLTLGKQGREMAACGGYMSTVTETPGNSSQMSFNVNAHIEAFDESKQTQHSYTLALYQTSGSFNGMISYASFKPIPTNGSTTASSNTMASGCLTSVTLDEKRGRFAVDGHIGARPLKASGSFSDGFWMATKFSVSKRHQGIFASSLIADPSCYSGDSTKQGCSSYTFNGMLGSSETGALVRPFVSGVASSSDQTWNASIPLPAPFSKLSFAGTFKDGNFEGNGDNQGIAWSVKGRSGNGCLFTSEYSISCASVDRMEGLDIAYMSGCGTFNPKDNSFKVSGFKQSDFSATGTVSLSGGNATLKGSATLDGKKTTFEGTGSAAPGVPMNVTVGGVLHHVSIFKLDNTIGVALYSPTWSK